MSNPNEMHGGYPQSGNPDSAAAASEDAFQEMRREMAELRGMIAGMARPEPQQPQQPSVPLPGDEAGWNMVRNLAGELARVDQERYGQAANEAEAYYRQWLSQHQLEQARDQKTEILLDTRLAREGIDTNGPLAGLVRSAVAGGASLDDAFEHVVEPWKAQSLREAEAAAQAEQAMQSGRALAIEQGDGSGAPPPGRTSMNPDQAATEAIIRAEQSGLGSRGVGDPFSRMFGE